jgi:hypothetical protein
MEEIDCPTDYPYYNTLINKRYISFKNSQEGIVCEFEHTNNNTGLKLTQVARCDGNSYLAIKALIGHFLITNQFRGGSWRYFVQCTQSQNEVDVVRPESLSIFNYAEAVKKCDF